MSLIVNTFDPINPFVFYGEFIASDIVPLELSYGTNDAVGNKDYSQDEISLWTSFNYGNAIFYFHFNKGEIYGTAFNKTRIITKEGLELIRPFYFIFFEFIKNNKPPEFYFKQDTYYDFVIKDISNNTFFQSKLNSLGYSNLELIDGVYSSKRD